MDVIYEWSLVRHCGLAILEDGGRGEGVDRGLEDEGRAAILGILVELARAEGLDCLELGR